MIISFAIWQLFNALIGWIEGAYWHFRNTVILSNHYRTPYADKLNLHNVLFELRVLIAIALTYICINENTISLICFITALIISQPYFHLGMMYKHRNKLDSRTYPKGFKDCNAVELGDSSKIDLFLYNVGLKQVTYDIRLAGLIISILLVTFALWTT